MRIVLDANIVIAAILGSRAKLIIITSQNHKFYAPSRIINEIKKYKLEICKKLDCEKKDNDLTGFQVFGKDIQGTRGIVFLLAILVITVLLAIVSYRVFWIGRKK